MIEIDWIVVGHHAFAMALAAFIGGSLILLPVGLLDWLYTAMKVEKRLARLIVRVLKLAHGN